MTFAKNIINFQFTILYIKVIVFVRAVPGNFFQALLIPCRVLYRGGGGLGLSVCVFVAVITQLTADGPETSEVLKTSEDLNQGGQNPR